MPWRPDDDEDEQATSNPREWLRRDDPEQMKYFNMCAVIHHGYPATQEVLDHFIKDQKERVAEGDAMWVTEIIPAFNLEPKCPKCGYDGKGKKRFHAHYVGAERAEVSCPKHAGAREHMHRCCPRCDYGWAEKCLTEEEHGYNIPAFEHG